MTILKLHNNLQTILSFYCIFIGVTSYYFDYRTGKHIQTKFTKYYTILVNVITVLTTPLALYYALQIVDSFSFSPLIKYSNYVNLTTRSLAILYTSLFRWLREQQHLQMREELQFLDPYYLSHESTNVNINVRLKYLYFLKFAAFTYQNFNALYCSAWIEHYEAWQKLVVTLVAPNLLNILSCTMFYYFLFMWWVCITYQQVNETLSKLLTLLSDDNDDDSVSASSKQPLLEMQQLRRVHWHITNAVEILSRISQFQLLANICASTVTNIVNGYYGIMWLFAYKEPLKWSLVLLGSSSYVMLFVDMYLLDIMCDDVIQSYHKTIRILGRSCELSLPQDIHNFCDQFALQLISRKFRISLCGMFQIDKMNTFSIIIQTIFYVILLVQFDFILGACK